METINKQRKIDWARYAISLIITAAIFGTALYISSIAGHKRLNEIRAMQDSLAIDLLSSETQFSLLNTAGCTNDGKSILAPEIGEMGDRLAFMEGQLGTDNEQVIGLKKYYSLLQIKDYMLASELAEKCQKKSVVVVYFYTNKDCPDCTKQGYVLTALREKYPELRVYSFDADLDLSAIKTLQTVTGVSSQMPTLVINGKAYAGFQSIEDIEKNPQIKKLADAQKTADQYKTSE